MEVKKAFLFGMVAILVIGGIVSCDDENDDSLQMTPSPGTTLPTLKDVQIREYQGEKLGSVDDFRENSIDGPQHVDIVNYTLDITGLVETPLGFS